MKNIVIFVSVLMVLSISACAKRGAPKNEKQVPNVTLPYTKDIAETPNSIVRRYVDEEYGNVCYVYIETISCVPLKK